MVLEKLQSSQNSGAMVGWLMKDKFPELRVLNEKPPEIISCGGPSVLHLPYI